MGRKAPIGKSKVISSGSKGMATTTVKSQGGIPPRGRVDRGGSNAGPAIVRNDAGSKY